MVKKTLGLLFFILLVILTACSNNSNDEKEVTPNTILEHMKTDFIGTVYFEGDDWYHDKYTFSDYLGLFIGFYPYNYSYIDSDAVNNFNTDFIIYSKLYLRYADHNFNSGFKVCSKGVLYNDAFSIMNNVRSALDELEIYDNRISSFNNFILGTGTYEVSQLNDKSFLLVGNGKTFKFSLKPDVPNNVITYSSNNLLSTEGKWIKD